MLLLLVACTEIPTSVTLSGTLLDASGGLGDPVAGATLSVLDTEVASFDEATTEADGTFAVEVPAGEGFFLNVSAEGLVSTAFNGRAGVEDFEATGGVPWIAQPSFVEDVRADHAACATSADAGTIVVGQVRQYLGFDDVDSMPPVEGAVVTVAGSDAAELGACYLDADGASVADATATGAGGGFAVFGAPEGPLVVDVRWEDPGGTEVGSQYLFVAPADGLVPVFPATVEAYTTR